MQLAISKYSFPNSFTLQVQPRCGFKGLFCRLYCVYQLFFPCSDCTVRWLRTKRHGSTGCDPGSPAVWLPGGLGLSPHPYSKGQKGLEKDLRYQQVPQQRKFPCGTTLGSFVPCFGCSRSPKNESTKLHPGWSVLFSHVPPQLSKGFGGEKEGIQYTNDAFSNDEDGSSTRSSSPNEGTVIALEQPRTTAQDLEKYLTPKEPLAPIQDNAAGSDGDDKEKEVRPILTKGRRQDEGYKSVWFKEDIDPEAKEEVVIIPDSRENDSNEEEQEQTDGNREESHRGTSETKRPKTGVVFKDEKPNSRGEDLQDDKVLNVDL